MDVDPEYEDLFNEVYDDEHIPNLLSVPGVTSISRLKGQPFYFAIGDGIKEMSAPSPIYTAIYEIDSPDVVSSPEWASAVEEGRWASKVRPFTNNRFHAVYKKRYSVDS